MSSVNFDVCSFAFVMYLLDGVPLSIFVLIRDYCTSLSLDGFPNATTLLSLSFVFKVKIQVVGFKNSEWKSFLARRLILDYAYS